jgi:arginine decarboxylase
MSREAERQGNRIDRFFAGPAARADQWCHLMELADAWSNGTDQRAAFEAALAEMAPTEEFHAYPGLQLIDALLEYSTANDAHAAARLTRRVTRAILTRSFRQSQSDWDVHDDGEAAAPGSLHPALTRTEGHRPYFEVLIVTSAPAARWLALASEWRRLRRPMDPFIYEPVIVGSFEDAFCAAVLNTDLAAWPGSDPAAMYESLTQKLAIVPDDALASVARSPAIGDRAASHWSGA